MEIWCRPAARTSLRSGTLREQRGNMGMGKKGVQGKIRPLMTAENSQSSLLSHPVPHRQSRGLPQDRCEHAFFYTFASSPGVRTPKPRSRAVTKTMDSLSRSMEGDEMQIQNEIVDLIQDAQDPIGRHLLKLDGNLLEVEQMKQVEIDSLLEEKDEQAHDSAGDVPQLMVSQTDTPTKPMSFPSQQPSPVRSSSVFSHRSLFRTNGSPKSPFLEAQPTSNNAHLLLSPVPPRDPQSPSATSTPVGVDPLDSISQEPDALRAGQLNLSSQQTNPAVDVGIPSKRPTIAPSTPINRVAGPSPAVAPVPHVEDPPSSPIDPALAQFRIARTFRTRTTLQLQPYTRERQIYEAALRRGGLKKGRHAIAQRREISSDEEDDEDEGQVESSSSAEIDPVPSETIVIGNTPPPRPPRQLLEVTDADRDEYFLQFGESPNADEDEEDRVVVSRLQKIARRRRREEKEERKKRRQKEQERRQFERFLHGENNETERQDGDEKHPKRTQAQKVSAKTPGRPKVYSRKAMAARTASPDPLDGLHSPDNAVNPPPQLSLSATSNVDGPQTSFRTPLSPLGDNEAVGTVDGFDFFVDDLPRSDRRPPQSVSSAASAETESDEPRAEHDPRAKIARRMLPAAMLRRLEREEAARQKRTAESKRRRSKRTESPVRPGRAVVRRNEGDVDVSGFLDEVASSQEESLEKRPTATEFTTPARMVQRELIVVSDDGGSDSSTSQAVEDNGAAETLARLYDGDFESIIGGRNARAKSRAIRSKPGNRQRRHRQNRPALGLAKRTTIPASGGRTTLVQTMLDFAVEDRSPKTAPKKRTRVSTKPRPRPAIRLDDHIIFATGDFAFENPSGEVETPHKRLSIPSAPPRSFKRTASKPQVGVETVDANVGKARSWANFDRFPIDFEISPLPSGLFFGPTTIVGSGAVSQLVQLVCGEQGNPAEIIPAVSAFGVKLKWDLSATEVVTLVPILFEGMISSLNPLPGDHDAVLVDTSPFAFLGPYISARRLDDGDAMVLREHISEISSRLDAFSAPSSKLARVVRIAILQLRWHLFELTCRLCLLRSSDDTDADIGRQSTSLISQLLRFGFDKTIRPLKQVLRGELESAELNDVSVSIWISLIHSLAAWDLRQGRRDSSLVAYLGTVLDATFPLDIVGPIAAERVWFIVFGLCALSQFDASGRTTGAFRPVPHWALVRRAVSLIKTSHNEEAEERAHADQLRGRDKYIRVMMARCVRLSAIWKWNFDRESFSVATKDLGVIFKDRQHRNLPTEPPVDYPDFITNFDMSLTAAEDTKYETAFELYLRLLCVAASDIIAAAQSLPEAQQAERDVQRLIMSTIPVSPVKFNRILPPSPRQLGQLINRHSTMIAACYFSPSLLSWLLANSRKWAPFEQADFDSRQISIRGLMYLAVVCRHHEQSVEPVITRLADMLGILQKELDDAAKPSIKLAAASGVEVERTMVLIVACFRQIILHHSFDVEQQARPAYPDPCLLHESWTARVFSLDLANDLKCGNEIVSTIQAYLDTRASALPRLARQRRQARTAQVESQDEFSLGIDFDYVDLAALGGEVPIEEDPIEKLEARFAMIVNTVISPKIYRLLSDMLPGTIDETMSAKSKSERQAFINNITKCWSDCAGVLVVERDSPDGWTPYIGSYGKESWQRLHNDAGRLQVGLHFMLNVAKIDPGCFHEYEQEFITLVYQTIVTANITVEHDFLAATLRMTGGAEHVLLRDFRELIPDHLEIDQGAFLEYRAPALEAVFSRLPALLSSPRTPASLKSLVYRCVNLLVSALVTNEQSIDHNKVIQHQSYRAFANTLVRALTRLAGDYVNHTTVPGLKHFQA
ncbi:Mus7/MMS22 family-domain-containing protein [Naematelia encephala]|uniref:Mus7/MMS22 family-domain-containing protein n=1 Tax=Naematelia encephala TaxID=71784 RepID=A0A1Y2B7P6_9TREE|nr:Mus7/MMS22 family-domain-containing protein [Naematelia encephala]